MTFMKFKIIQSKEEHTLETNLVDIIFNINHVVSIKPIKIILGESIIDGYWIRLTNGKKYKATSIPTELRKIFISSEEEKSEEDLSSKDSLHLH
ncbi:MAG: hypothetical protein CME68_02805 [Halobacteriovoraceae bacterium]|nr:hypothetical protein [Halobacteriovoraceae bacterium]|tara:strand:- start:2182 stop:2463 length:282 start_codon:yes stop_codon:yes gene_type:complete